MELSELSTIVAGVVVALGGGGAIVLGLSKWIGEILATRYVEKVKHELQQEGESYRTKLRKSEFLFQKQFEATSQFMALRRSIEPAYRHPDMDWGEACEDFALAFPDVEKKLNRYISIHGAALNKETLKHLSDIVSLVSANKFETAGRDQASTAGIEAAEKALAELEKVESEMCAVVWDQSST